MTPMIPARIPVTDPGTDPARTRPTSRASGTSCSTDRKVDYPVGAPHRVVPPARRAADPRRDRGALDRGGQEGRLRGDHRRLPGRPGASPADAGRSSATPSRWAATGLDSGAELRRAAHASRAGPSPTCSPRRRATARRSTRRRTRSRPATAPAASPASAGVLTDPAVMRQFYSNMAFRRVRWVQETFACTKFPAEVSTEPTGRRWRRASTRRPGRSTRSPAPTTAADRLPRRLGRHLRQLPRDDEPPGAAVRQLRRRRARTRRPSRSRPRPTGAPTGEAVGLPARRRDVPRGASASPPPTWPRSARRWRPTRPSPSAPSPASGTGRSARVTSSPRWRWCPTSVIDDPDRATSQRSATTSRRSFARLHERRLREVLGGDHDDETSHSHDRFCSRRCSRRRLRSPPAAIRRRRSEHPSPSHGASGHRRATRTPPSTTRTTRASIRCELLGGRPEEGPPEFTSRAALLPEDALRDARRPPRLARRGHRATRRAARPVNLHAPRDQALGVANYAARVARVDGAHDRLGGQAVRHLRRGGAGDHRRTCRTARVPCGGSARCSTRDGTCTARRHQLPHRLPATPAARRPLQPDWSRRPPRIETLARPSPSPPLAAAAHTCE